MELTQLEAGILGAMIGGAPFMETELLPYLRGLFPNSGLRQDPLEKIRLQLGFLESRGWVRSRTSDERARQERTSRPQDFVITLAGAQALGENKHVALTRQAFELTEKSLWLLDALFWDGGARLRVSRTIDRNSEGVHQLIALTGWRGGREEEDKVLAVERAADKQKEFDGAAVVDAAQELLDNFKQGDNLDDSFQKLSLLMRKYPESDR